MLMDTSLSLFAIQLLTLLSFIPKLPAGATSITHNPDFACEGESIRVSCVLTPPKDGDIITSIEMSFIIGDTNGSISRLLFDNSNIVHGFNLSRFVVDAPSGNVTHLTGSITLLAYDSSTDEGLRIGCSGSIRRGGASMLESFIQTVRLLSSGSSISFSPDLPLCIGEEVEMICFVESSVQFRSTDARVSINSSVPPDVHFPISQLNLNATLNGTDLSRYTANLDGLNVSKCRPGIRLIIKSYQPSDSDTIFRCCGEFMNFTVSHPLISGKPNPSAAPPSAPSLQSSVSNFNTATCSADISLSWNTPPSDRTVDKYFLYIDGSPLATTNSNSHIHSTILNVNTDYQYSVTAMNCAGNSANSNIIIYIANYSLMDCSKSMCLGYMAEMLTIDWVLSTPTQPSGVSGLYITYSLELLYSHSRQGVTYTYTDSTSFTLPSSQLRYNTTIATHNFTQLDGVETNITANLTIVQQCGQSYNGIVLEYSSTSFQSGANEAGLSTILSSFFTVLMVIIL